MHSSLQIHSDFSFIHLSSAVHVSAWFSYHLNVIFCCVYNSILPDGKTRPWKLLLTLMSAYALKFVVTAEIVGKSEKNNDKILDVLPKIFF